MGYGEYIFYNGMGPDGRTPTSQGHKLAIKLLNLLKRQKVKDVKYEDLVKEDIKVNWYTPIIKISFKENN